MSPEPKKPRGRPSKSFPPLARCMPVEDWPALDRLTWMNACRSAGLLDEAGRAAALSPRTRFTRAKTWGWFLNYLNVVGELDSSEPLAGRLTPARLDGYIRSLRARVRASTAWHEIVELSYMAALLAPEQDWSWIRRRPELPSAREVRASRKPLNPPDPSQLFYNALLYCRAADDERGSIPSAVRFRNGLIMALATWSVLRRRNLSEMQLGMHLQTHGGIARIVFDKVKNGQTIDSLVPDSLLPVLMTYLRRHRPLLLRGRADCQYLWINRVGRPLEYAAFRSLFECMGRRLIGRPLSVHSIRHGYVTTTLSLDARDIEVVSAGLAHSGTSSTGRYYDRSSTNGVCRAWLKIVAQRRRFA